MDCKPLLTPVRQIHGEGWFAYTLWQPGFDQVQLGKIELDEKDDNITDLIAHDPPDPPRREMTPEEKWRIASSLDAEVRRQTVLEIVGNISSEEQEQYRLIKKRFDDMVRVFMQRLQVGLLLSDDAGTPESALADNEELAEMPDAMQAAETPQRYIFRKAGDYWQVAYAGIESFYLKDAKGVQYIAHLLRHPSTDIHVMELVTAVEKNQPDDTVLDGDEITDKDDWRGDEILDSQARTEYRQRLQDLAEERQHAARSHDEATLMRVDAEVQQIESELQSAGGLGGRHRRFNTELDNARTKVQKQIKSVLHKIRASDRALFEHLQNALATGVYCRYDPAHGIEWET
ncbi:MAG: hypothetical protein JW850_23795 [Thermoflexales bacterium]|nr:hypothetical protein [Thermoflexales bacterium]